MGGKLWMVGVVLAGSLGVAGASGPPAATADRLKSALEVLEKDHFAGRYTMTTKAVIAKPDGSNREETSEVAHVVQDGSAEPEVTLVSSLRDGKDVTAERQKQMAESRAKEAEKGKKPEKDEDGFSASMRLPLGEDEGLFEYGPPRSEGAVLVAPFAPTASGRKKDNMTEGRLAWDPATGDPLWLEARYVDPPTGIKEMLLRFELARAGDLLYLRRTVTKGVGGMLWIKRTFDVEMVISEIQPAPPSS
ncbi:MAG: hypothetical protein MUF10_12940 [Thermoanaerobaculaceae bacterium]|jgi:hypothetical protein|nr:hypothetical protein [Thermoanaerobaculaceae bacterium]